MRETFTSHGSSLIIPLGAYEHHLFRQKPNLIGSVIPFWLCIYRPEFCYHGSDHVWITFALNGSHSASHGPYIEGGRLLVLVVHGAVAEVHAPGEAGARLSKYS